MINTTEPKLLSAITEFYKEAFQAFDKTRSCPPIDVRFYPYIGINHTIRIRSGKIYVRISETCHDMPAEAQRALAYILTAKLLRKTVPGKAKELYSFYTKTPEMRQRAASNKLARGRKLISSAKGDVYDLDEIFSDINKKYFGDTVKEPVLTWSSRKTYRILGHHDATHEAIVISRSLDRRDVPKYVVEYVVFHEMLHIVHPTIYRNGRRYNHTPAFKRDEERFADLERTMFWIEENLHRLKRLAKRKR